MIIEGKRYLLTRHGRERYLLRVNPHALDREILESAVQGMRHYVFIWAPDRKRPDTKRLVTVYYAPTHPKFKGLGQDE